jgi:hypothetical protein
LYSSPKCDLVRNQQTGDATRGNAGSPQNWSSKQQWSVMPFCGVEQGPAERAIVAVLAGMSVPLLALGNRTRHRNQQLAWYETRLQRTADAAHAAAES